MKVLHRYYCAAFLLDCSLLLGFTAVPFFVINQLERGPATIGAIHGAFGLCYAAFCLLTAGLISRVKNPVTWAALGGCVFAVLFCFAPMFRNPYLYCLVATAGVAAAGLTWPVLHAWLGAEPDLARRQRHLSHYTVAWSAGMAVGPLFSGPLYDVDYRFPFGVVFLMMMVAMGLLRSLPHEQNRFTAPGNEVEVSRVHHDRASESFLYCAWFANLVAYALLGVSRSVFADRVNDLVQAGELVLFTGHASSTILLSGAATKFSWLSFTVSAASALTCLAMGRTWQWRHKFSWLLLVQIGAASAFWVLSWTNSLLVMAVCCAFVGVNGGFCAFASVYYGIAHLTRKRRNSAVHEGTVGLGSFIGAMGFGWMAARYGVTTPFAYTPLLIVCALAVQFFLFRYGTYRLDSKAPVKP